MFWTRIFQNSALSLFQNFSLSRDSNPQPSDNESDAQPTAPSGHTIYSTLKNHTIPDNVLRWCRSLTSIWGDVKYSSPAILYTCLKFELAQCQVPKALNYILLTCTNHQSRNLLQFHAVHLTHSSPAPTNS